jgi:hypothetical protein
MTAPYILALVGGLVAVIVITPRARTAWAVWRIRREYRRDAR